MIKKIMTKWFEPWPLWCLCSALPVKLPGQTGSRLLCGSINISPLMWNNYHCLTTLSLVGKRRRRALVGCGRMASNSGSKPKTSTKLQVGFNPRFVTNYNEEWRVLRNQGELLVKPFFNSFNNSTFGRLSSVYFDIGLMLEISALFSQWKFETH